MYLECESCGNPDIEIIGPYSTHPFYCPVCKEHLGFDDVKIYRAIATHYTNQDFKSILVTNKLQFTR